MTRILGSMVMALFIAGSVLPGPASGQTVVQWRGSGGWGAGSAYDRLYNLTTVGNVTGQVAGIESFVPVAGMSPGVRLLVTVNGERITVHLGPQWFIENQDFAFRPGDRVEVRGSKVAFDGRPEIMASVVRVGPEILRLRDEKGFPAWSAVVPR